MAMLALGVNRAGAQGSAVPVLPDAPQAQSSSQPPVQAPAEGLAPGSIVGAVVDRDGAIYQGVGVTLTRDPAAAIPDRTVTTDADGRFLFEGVAPGPFRITVSSSGFTTQQISGVLHPGESIAAKAIVLPLAAASSEVRVTASQEEIAEAQLKDEEKQYILGILPNFYVVYAPNAAPLTTKQKYRLAWRSSIDPMTFLITGVFAGVEQADNSFKGYGQGASGYARRYAASYGDNVIGTILGGAVLPSLLKQDPRYFVKGTGSTRSRIWYAIANSVMCRGDNGRSQVNYSGIVGSLAAGGISNLYYPDGERSDAALTFENAVLGIATGAAQNLLQEFVIRKLTPKAPNYSASKP